MKTLFIGGVKSGKSRLAEAFTLKQTTQKPFYLATTEFIDDEMQSRIDIHQQRRQDLFNLIEEPINLANAIETCSGPVLIECISMWLNNMLYRGNSEELILKELNKFLGLPNDLVIVQNEVGMGVIPDNPLARQFVDISGKTSQLLANACDQVFFCCAGLSLRLK